MVRLVAPRDSICIFIIWCVRRTASLGCHCRSSTVEKTSSKSLVSSLQRFFFFLGWGPEEGDSHSSGGALIKSIKSFWSSHSHQPVSSKEKWALLTLKIKEEGNFPCFCLVSSLPVKDSTPSEVVWRLSMHPWCGEKTVCYCSNWEEGRHLRMRNLLGKLSAALGLEGLFYLKQGVCHVLQKRGHGTCPSVYPP